MNKQLVGTIGLAVTIATHIGSSLIIDQALEKNAFLTEKVSDKNLRRVVSITTGFMIASIVDRAFAQIINMSD